MADKVTVIIPTLGKSNFILYQLITTLNFHPEIKEILIFDNTCGEFKTTLSKVKVFSEENLQVNPAWNIGVEKSTTEYYLLLNDDVLFNNEIIDACIEVIEKDPKNIELVTVNTKDSSFLSKLGNETSELEYTVSKSDIVLQGWFMFGKKSKWKPVDNRLKYFFGDNLIYLNAINTGLVARITNRFICHAPSTTVTETKLYESGVIQEEEKIFREIIGDTSIRILIGTPSHDFTLHALYVESLMNTEAVCKQNNIQIQHIFLCGDALVQRARNDIFKIAYDGGFDKLVFIDNDMSWNPSEFLKLVSYDKDVIGAPCRKKSDEHIDFNVSIKDKSIDENGLMNVNGVGTGFLAVSRNAIKKLYESSEEYIEKDLMNNKKRMVFDIGIVNGELYSEDIIFCKKWRDLGGEIFVDANMTIGHVGQKTYIGNLKRFIDELENK